MCNNLFQFKKKGMYKLNGFKVGSFDIDCGGGAIYNIKLQEGAGGANMQTETKIKFLRLLKV